MSFDLLDVHTPSATTLCLLVTTTPSRCPNDAIPVFPNESVDFFFKKNSHFHQWPMWAGSLASGDEEACEREAGLHDGVECSRAGPSSLNWPKCLLFFFLDENEYHPRKTCCYDNLTSWPAPYVEFVWYSFLVTFWLFSCISSRSKHCFFFNECFVRSSRKMNIQVVIYDFSSWAALPTLNWRGICNFTIAGKQRASLI